MTRSVDSARAAGKIFDFRSSLLAALEANIDLAALEPLPDAPVVGAADAEIVLADEADDPQWIVWSDATAESTWAAFEALPWANAAQILGWRA
jgi:hypothetical protein